ncbi:beta-ketoacyl-ACP synthase III [Botrimarina mediterranea]|uniref:Beta-ketoacyl-[acyl-carrier-protein] synthase III n=1 Tax=Botrimarina mediterranea TaxID=2528022 RepID=A0A518KDN9_9BACT|nr:beta-ketoacyl-ACP synthase III [Botrimarina mediterranea]QDV75914.1 3-oxoacyl-[acyl-carrier-protein] synthase 3 [Botrimarina mediterranea]QDV80509.1 3-oxoacyl-[acyl-carrier-protein] synthase 3 [Planctomycetes bacterium K2D]
MSDVLQHLQRGPLFQLTGVRIAGTGSCVPDLVVTNEDLGRLGCDPEWISQRTGIHERRHAPPGLSTSHLAAGAARQAIAAAEIDPADIDLILLATFTPDRLLPQTATAVQQQLGLKCPAMDLVAACAGFMYALITGAQFVATGSMRNVLVIGADTNTRVLNPDDKKTFPLFGDGAGAVILTRGSSEQGLLAATLGADGGGTDLLTRRVGGVERPFSLDCPAEPGVEGGIPWLMEMDGRPVFKWAVRLLEDTFEHVLTAAGRDKEAVKLWLLHQANARILDAATDSMGVPRERVVKHLDRYGNTSAGSIPIALDESVRAGLVKSGDELMMCGFGAGLSWGTALWKW